MSERSEVSKPAREAAIVAAPPQRHASLQVAPVDDPLEHEAERVANRLTAGPAPGGLLQRAPDAEGLGERRPTSAPAATAPPVVHDVLASPGQPLEAETRAYFEPRLGMDLGDVRVHDDDRAARSADAVDARAYTVGRDVVFAANRHAPHTSEGRALLGHELVHVGQQRAARSATSREAVLARAPAEPAGPTLEQRVAAGEVHDKLVDQDIGWDHLIDGYFSDCIQAVDLITAALEEARAGFTKAQIDQAEFNALVLQILLGALTFAGAYYFEPLATGVLTALGNRSRLAAARIERWAPEGIAEGERIAAGVENIVERVENPVVGASGSSENVIPMISDVEKPGEVPTFAEAPPGAETPPGVAEAVQAATPLAYLTSYGRAIESNRERIHEAFATRAAERQRATPEQLLTIDLATEEAKYIELFASLPRMLSIKELKSQKEVADNIERVTWAAWITQQTVPAAPTTPSGPFETVDVPSPASIYIGTFVADRLNTIGVSKLAGVTLGTNWYTQHSPGNYAELLLQWANTYRPSLLTGG